MDPAQWMARFRVAHEKAKAKQLTDEEHKTYLEMREELARSLVSAQALQVSEGKNYRKHFRVAQMYQIEIASTYQTMTRQVSRGGFMCTLQAQLSPGQEVAFALTLTRGKDPVTGKAKVVSAMKQAGGFQTSFQIDVISEENGERLESALFDAVLSRFK